jgi:hypothetical protein
MNIDVCPECQQVFDELRAELKKRDSQPVLAWTDRYGYLFTPAQHEELGVGTIALIAKPELK